MCPVSNVALGVYSDLTSVPLPTLLEAGATVALGADDPLLFGSQLAAQYAGRGVVGFGLSNDERRGTTSEFAPAFSIAERAGLLLVPHGGELRGPEHISQCLDELHAQRLGHGIRAAEDPDLLDLIVSRDIALEVCPVSNVALGVYTDLSSVPLPDLMAAGATIALGADDPLLFGSQLASQYATMRAAHDLTDDQLAELARMSVRASAAPDDVKERLLVGIDDWLLPSSAP